MEVGATITRQSALLENVGLSSYEARLYVALINHGPQNVSRLSLLAGVPRTKVYGALKKLVERNMVTQSRGKPQLFLPNPPDTALSLSLQALRVQAREFEEVFRDLRQAYESSVPASGIEAINMWLVRGRKRIFEKASEMLSSAQSNVEIACYEDGFIELYKATRRIFEKFLLNGVEVVAIVPKEARKQFLMRELNMSGEVKFKFIDSFPPILFLKVDSTRSMLAIFGKDDACDIGVIEDGTLLHRIFNSVMMEKLKEVNITPLVEVPMAVRR